MISISRRIRSRQSERTSQSSVGDGRGKRNLVPSTFQGFCPSWVSPSETENGKKLEAVGHDALTGVRVGGTRRARRWLLVIGEEPGVPRFGLHCAVGLFIVEPDGSDGDIVQRRAKAIRFWTNPSARTGKSGLWAISPIEQGDTMETIHEPSDGVSQKSGVRRREFLRLGAIGGAAVAAGAVATTWAPQLRQRGLLSADGVFDAASIAWANDLYDEEFPTSPLILNPFSDELPVPQALRPEPYGDWTYWPNVPGPEDGCQNSYGNDRHQRWCGDPRSAERQLRWCTRSS